MHYLHLLPDPVANCLRWSKLQVIFASVDLAQYDFLDAKTIQIAVSQLIRVSKAYTEERWTPF
jgi:hypothetical protein